MTRPFETGHRSAAPRPVRRVPILRLLFVSMLAVAAGGLQGCTHTATSAADTELAPLAPDPVSEANSDLARGSLAAVEIRGQPSITVRETVESVFTSAGLTVSRRDAEQLVFERPASKAERRAYGNWQGEEVRIRLRVDVMEQGPSLCFVRSRGFLVRDPSSSSEDEQPLARRRLRQYEHLLDEVAVRLN